MKRWYRIFALLPLIFILFIYVNCTSRHNPADVVYPSGTVWFYSLESDTLQGNLLSNSYVRNVFIYDPPGYDQSDPSTLYPVLYFLHGFLETALDSTGPDLPYPYGLAETADRLIATGQIQPMIIVMANCKSNLGGVIPAGSFYVNSPSPNSDPSQSLNGKFESFYVHEVMKYVEDNLKVRKEKNYRAIAGHSMGGYGAFRIAMDYDTMFSIVGSLSGPLSFQLFSVASIPPGPLTLSDQIFAINGIDSTTYRDLSYESADELTTMCFAMAAAFSPHDSADTDSTSYFQVTPTGTTPYGVDLPFDSTGDPITSVWNIWIENDIRTRYEDDPTALDDMDVYVDCGDADEFAFNEQSRDFYDALASGPGDRFFEEYSGGGYSPADNSAYLYYRIEKLLKFVSRNLPQP